MRSSALLGAILCLGCAAHDRPQKQVIFYAPGHCVEVTGFAKPCVPIKGGQGYSCDGVRVQIKPDPECNEWNGQNVIDVKVK